jgi:hypothetical protein
MTSISTYRPAPSLAAADAGQTSIRRGQHGESVRQVQQMLQAAHFSVVTDGYFGSKTENAIKAFQRQANLNPDGRVGELTLAALRGGAPASAPAAAPASAPTAAPAGGAGHPVATWPLPPTAARQPLGTPVHPSGMDQNSASPVALGQAVPPSEREKYEFYASIIRRHGGQVNPNGVPTVLGMRAVAPGAGVSSNNRFDDTFVVLLPSGRVHEFRGATHPAQYASSISPDVNRDGRGDVGMIRPGNYMAVPNGNFKGRPSFHIKTMEGSGRLPGWRDTNQDGVYSPEELRASEARGDGLTEVLFHRGNELSATSIGCQTLSSADYDRFVSVLGGANASFSYTLVDANI